jgi:predicted dehydrogenase
MSTELRVGFVGCGSRVTDHYFKVIPHVGGLTVSGFTSKTCKSIVTHEGLELPAVTDVHALAEMCDIVSVCVPHQLTTGIVCELIKHDVHIIVETPIYDYTLVELAQQNNATRRHKISVAENWPFRPSELLKRRIVGSGVIGRLNAVVNDFRGYEYHAFAMMRAYDRSRPNLQACVGTHFSSGDVIVTAQDGSQKTLTENWDIGVIPLESGVRLLHSFNSIHSRAKTRGPRSLRALCSNGAISSDDFNDFRVEWDVNGIPQRAEPDVYLGAMHSEIAGVGVVVAGEEFTWRSPVCDVPFNEEDLSILYMFEEVRNRIHTEHVKDVVYSVEESYIDSLCVNTIAQRSL